MKLGIRAFEVGDYYLWKMDFIKNSTPLKLEALFRNINVSLFSLQKIVVLDLIN